MKIKARIKESKRQGAKKHARNKRHRKQIADTKKLADEGNFLPLKVVGGCY